MAFSEDKNSSLSNEEASFLFSTARLKAIRMRPYFASCLLALLPIRKKIGTVGVDEFGRIYYDPETLKKWGVEESAGVLIHECGHILRFHAQRARFQGVTRLTARTWNLAGDMSINDDLEEEGLLLPEPRVSPTTMGLKLGLNIGNGRAEEEYYWLIKEKIEKNHSIVWILIAVLRIVIVMKKKEIIQIPQKYQSIFMELFVVPELRV